MVQLTLVPVMNEKLFSRNYLETRLPMISLWVEVENEAKRSFEYIKRKYREEKESLPNYNEDELEEEFIRPILKNALGHIYALQEKVKRSAKKPDYAFFKSKEAKREAIKKKKKRDFYLHAIAVGDAKYWERNLDVAEEVKYRFENLNPSYQINYYLRETSKNWGILTNGRRWRLYYRERSHRLDTYYEVDLVTIIETNDYENFKYFYLFFRREAFTPEGNSFLDKVFSQSLKYTKRIGKELEENVYKILLQMTRGFFDNPDNQLQYKSLDIEEVYNNSLIFLYQLLFLFYVESKGFIGKEIPRKYQAQFSFAKWVDDILKEYDEKSISKYDTRYNHRLKSILELIDVGSESKGISKDDFFVPPYNGGLFSNEKYPFLQEKEIRDTYLSTVIDLLVRTQIDKNEEKVRIDYSDLSIRHIGSIYEGILEYKLNVATTDMVVVKDKKSLKWVPLKKTKKEFDEYEEDKRVRKGELYLLTDRKERKKSGSYFTPEYVVEYIVSNALDPIMKRKLSKAKTIEEKREAILSLNIVDPAMGSGHFLVEVIDHLGVKLAQYISNGENKNRDIDLAKREIARNCIYGVDKNPLATELAKVSIWLNTIGDDKPLSFIDHHLKTGNSFLGSDIHKLNRYPKEQTTAPVLLITFLGDDVNQKIEHLLSIYKDIVGVIEERPEDIREQEKLYINFENDPFRKKIDLLADVFTSYHLKNKFSETQYETLIKMFRGGEEQWNSYIKNDWIENAVNISKRSRFFHWKLAFPEVFFDIKTGKERENPGFDVVVGNPPWGAKLDDREKYYTKAIFRDIIDRMTDTYMFFIKQSYDLIRAGGKLGFIIPNPFLTQSDVTTLRKYLLNSTKINRIVNLGDNVFGEDIANPSCIAIFTKGKPGKAVVKIQDVRSLKPKNKSVILEYINVETVEQSKYKETHNYSFITRGIENEELVSKLKNKFKLLEDLISRVNRGISSDLNEAFIVSDETIAENELEREKLHLVLEGSSVRKYMVKKPSNYVIYLTKEDEIADYPNIKSYLKKFGSKITCSEAKKGKHPWYSLHRPRKREIFEGSKLVGLTTSNSLEIGLDRNHYYVMDSLYVFKLKEGANINEMSIVSILNSSLGNLIYKHFAQEENRVYPQVKAENLYPIPIPDSNLTKSIDMVDEYIKRLDEREIVTILEQRVRTVKDLLTDLGNLREDLTADIDRLNLDLKDYLGHFSFGKSLEQLSTPVANISESILIKTTKERLGLCTGSVEVREENGKLIIYMSARYKPEKNQEYKTDKWGYMKTDLIPALEFHDLSEQEKVLIKEFVPMAVEKAKGFADFRKKATGNISLIDRLEKLKLPKIIDVKSGLKKFLKVKEKTGDIKRKIKKVEQIIDVIVFKIYELSREEIGRVLDNIGRSEGEKKKILTIYSEIFERD